MSEVAVHVPGLEDGGEPELALTEAAAVEREAEEIATAILAKDEIAPEENEEVDEEEAEAQAKASATVVPAADSGKADDKGNAVETPEDGEEAEAEADAEADAAVKKEEEAPKKVKKKFQAKASPKCTLCEKSVYKTEGTLDSTDRVFHKSCLRCVTCKTSLAGRQPVSDASQDALSKSQYRVDEDGELFCDKHGQLTRGSVHKGAAVADSAKEREADRTLLRTTEVKAKTQEIKQEMEIMVGDNVPICGRCGGGLEGNIKVVVSGMERFHEVCPDVVEEVKRTPRYFVKKAEERPVVMVQINEHKPMSFLFELDADAKKAALLQKKAAVAEVLFHPDEKQRSTLFRKVPVADDASDAALKLDLDVRHEEDLSSTDPAEYVHTAVPGVELEGMATHKGKPVWVQLANSSLIVMKKQGDAKTLVEMLIDEASDVSRLEDGDAAGPGLLVKAKKVSGDKVSDDPVDLVLGTSFVFQAHAWVRAVEEAIKSADDDNSDYTRVVFRKFSVQGQVLHQYVFTFLYGKGRLGVANDAYLLLSQFPEATAKEQAKADPLAALKTDLHEKKVEEAKQADIEEKKAALEDKRAAKEAAKLEGGGGCCIVM